MKKIILFMFLFLLGILRVMAYDVIENFHFGSKVPDTYVKILNNGNIRNTTIWMIKKSDNNYVYCIDPFTNEINGNYEGYVGNNELFGLSKEQINRMNLLAYYGYGYQNHTDFKWYGITQFLIWQTLGYDDIYYTDSSFNNRIDKNSQEIDELNNLVNNHFIKPSFDINNSYSIGTEYTLIDNNNVLDLYDIDYSGDLDIKKEGNNLKVLSKQSGIYTIRFIKKSKIDNDYILYNNDIRQNMFYPGKYEDVVYNLTLNFISGSIEINKQDREHITSRDNTTFEGAVYGLYEDNELFKEISLDNNGFGILTDLPLGNYYIKEISSSCGYMLDDTKYEVNLTSNNNHQNIIVYEDVIENKFKIIKKYGNEITNNYYLESDVSFELYDSNNNLIDTYITDDNGEINMELPYGDYVLKQINGIDGYTINDDIKISVKNIDSDKELILVDKEIIKKGNLELKKMGSDGLLLDGVKFKLYAKEDIKSLTGDIYYHKDDFIDEVIINDGYGYLNDLYYGDYYLEEVNTVSGYLLNTDKIDVDINSDINNIEIINEKYEIPSTGRNDINYSKLSNIFIFIGLIGLYEIKNRFNNNI